MPTDPVVEVRRHPSLAEFMVCAGDLYRSDPVAFSTESGVLAELAAAPRPAQFLTAHSGGALVGAALRPLAYPLLTSGIGTEAVAAVAGYLHRQKITVPAILGLKPGADLFTNTWVSLSGATPTARADETVYRLQAFAPPESVAGDARRAAASDVGLLCEWLAAFRAEVFGSPAGSTPTAALYAQIVGAIGQFIMWQVDGVPVSLARVHPVVQGVARIGPVFTPCDQRGRGWAAAVTAAAISRARRCGAADIVLQTDVNNRTSNALYRRLGFVPIAACAQQSFA
jgi:predicted GNAT family acetyltransferase